MRLELRSSLFGAIAIVIALVSAMRVGRYDFYGMIGLLVALAVGLIAVSLRTPCVLAIPLRVGRISLATSVVLATVIGRITLWSEWTIPVYLHGAVTAIIVVFLMRGRISRFADANPLLALAALILPSTAACWDGLAYAEGVTALVAWLPWLSSGLFATIGFAVTRPVEQLERRTGMTLLVAMFILGGGIRIIGVVASPEPIIDVWSWRKEAPHYLINGMNPYGADYPDVYATERAKSYNLFDPMSTGSSRELPTYPPLPIYLSAPFAAIGLDVRYADVCCDVLAAAMLYFAGWTMRNRPVGIIAAGIYLGFPLSARVVEQSWYEPMLAALFGAGLVLLKRGYRIGSFLVGLGLVGKQFGLMLAPSTALACRRDRRSFAVGLGVAALLTIGVFLIWDAHWFLKIILFNHLGLKPRPDSLTLASLIYQEWGSHISSKYLWMGMIVICGYIAWRTPNCPVVGAAWIGMSLFVFCLFNIQANFNYYYFCVYLLLMGIVALSTNRDAEPQIDSARVRIASSVSR